MAADWRLLDDDGLLPDDAVLPLDDDGLLPDDGRPVAVKPVLAHALQLPVADGLLPDGAGFPPI